MKKYRKYMLSPLKNSGAILLHVLSLSLSLSLIFNANAAESSFKGPVFLNYGPVYKVMERDTPLPPNAEYKAVFDVYKTNEDHSKLNTNIESVARFINMHVANGVDINKINIAVVLHGKASDNGLNQAAYQARYTTVNPNLDLIEKLNEHGVKFYQCAQSLFFSGMEKEELAPQVNLALSAMTMFVSLQDQGYRLIP